MRENNPLSTEFFVGMSLGPRRGGGEECGEESKRVKEADTQESAAGDRRKDPAIRNACPARQAAAIRRISVATGQAIRDANARTTVSSLHAAHTPATILQFNIMQARPNAYFGLDDHATLYRACAHARREKRNLFDLLESVCASA